ncbi:hypothetical protein [Pasteuria penetrans]|uniref:hypothetical protein n=1 Tax=Pasteuria penetrans TaxID=86005 RepID=UPI0011ECD271|nr:hypothetical protein [Pasteuria penetrans]
MTRGYPTPVVSTPGHGPTRVPPRWVITDTPELLSSLTTIAEKAPLWGGRRQKGKTTRIPHSQSPRSPVL